MQSVGIRGGFYILGGIQVLIPPDAVYLFWEGV
jgi:hypothetical protein